MLFKEAKNHFERTVFQCYGNKETLDALNRLNSVLVVGIPIGYFTNYFLNSILRVKVRQYPETNLILDSIDLQWPRIKSLCKEQNLDLKVFPEYRITVIDNEWGRDTHLLDAVYNILVNNNSFDIPYYVETPTAPLLLMPGTMTEY